MSTVVEQLSPRSSETTVFSLSHQRSFWSATPPPGSCERYWRAVLIASSGASGLLCGLVLSGLYLAGVSVRLTGILGPALLSCGLMVLVVGVVLLPITRDTLQLSATKRLCSLYRPHLDL